MFFVLFFSYIYIKKDHFGFPHPVLSLANLYIVYERMALKPGYVQNMQRLLKYAELSECIYFI